MIDVNINDSVYGEKKVMDRLIVMDDVSGIADSCKEFADFLTVSRKYRYHCVYVFHIISPNKEIWQKIISQTNIFNIFSLQYSPQFLKILQNNCVQQTTKYVSVHSMCLNRVFIDLANTNQRNCLTIYCSSINQDEPPRYRTNTHNPVEQVCYFNEARNDQLYNIFISKQIKSGNFEKKGFIFKLTVFKARPIKKLLVLIRLGSSNDRLPKRGRGAKRDTADGDEGEDRYGKTSKQFQYVRESARPRFFSGQ